MKHILLASLIATTIAIGAPRDLHQASALVVKAALVLVNVAALLERAARERADDEEGGYDAGRRTDPPGEVA
jgi:hypothetical protein